jgi:hypothetical protein
MVVGLTNGDTIQDTVDAIDYIAFSLHGSYQYAFGTPTFGIEYGIKKNV